MRIKISPGNVCTRWHCTICGDCTAKTATPFAFIDPADGRTRFVCEQCIAVGPDLIRKLLKRADNLETYVAELRRLAENIFVTPTSEEIDRDCYKHEREVLKARGYETESWSFEQYLSEHGFEKWKQGFLDRLCPSCKDGDHERR
jgi:hypothetical protein